ncbi:E3 SUMO-protein ligase PIAS1-like [Melanaphis sacchari]|uniref:E3 SUMO-protein ligase PIAS1 n=1 Tax=Melanaphis sacchari TaxID=742174 RepID=A0A2H8TWV5_9HEMI|nr:E3 SUMO-protein ligase PIAS1-like [Melanaphis sacchari]XP_025203452.1 E3 SUMO-protein ligase PIAS1-like [Melanaphis sacchari]XP_025203453.1 E3 SUMO-protein ligase PIAS1-like [Melanaphis sacchari]
MSSINDDEILFHQMVHSFSLDHLRKILDSIPNQSSNGNESSLRDRLIYLLTSSNLSLKSLAIQKMVDVHWLRTVEMRPLESLHVDLSNISDIAEHLLVPQNEALHFEHDLPFFKTICTLLSPLYCKSEVQIITLHKFFYIEKSTRDLIVRSWDNDTKAYKCGVILRLEQIGEKPFTDRLPFDFKVSVNGHKCLLPKSIPKSSEVSTSSTNNTIPCQSNIHIDLTEYLDLNTSSQNSLDVKWSNEISDFIVGVYVVQKLIWKNLLVNLKKRPFCVAEKTIERIKEFAESEIDLLISIQDPITKLRMKLPARGIGCTHLQCFDAIHFLQMNEQKPMWLCPLCKKRIKFKNMEIDEYFLKIIENPNLSEECENIVLSKDGTWTEKKINAVSNNLRTNNCESTNIGVIILSDSEDDDIIKNQNV